MNEKSTIGQNIAQLRKKAELTQEELSVKMNVTAQAVSKWECDQSYPDLESIRRLAAILGTTADAILNGEESQPPVKLAAEGDRQKRVLSISIQRKDKDDSSNIRVRLPLPLIQMAQEEGTLSGLVGEEAATYLSTCLSAVSQGVVGPILEMKNDDKEILIEVTDYDA